MCLEENTGILMADGTQRSIREIRIGDMVMCDSGEPKIVRNIWQGTEEHMMCIEVRNGSKIILTDNHPIKTAAGIKRADAIDENDEIVMVYGEKHKISSISCIEYRNRVYNLDISGNFMIAEGIVVGDFEVQNRR